MSFKIEGDTVLVKYSEIWRKVKTALDMKYQNKPAYNEKYIKAKVKAFNDVVNTVFSKEKCPKENVHYIGVAEISVDSVIKIDKKTILKFI